MSPEPDLLPALVAESAKRSRVCWLSYRHPGGVVRDRLVWHAWHDDALLVLSGAGGQTLEGLAGLTGRAEEDRVEVTMRSKESGARLVTWLAAAAVVPRADERWEECAGALLGVRLNLPDPAAARQQWRDHGTILRLAPVGATADGGPGALP